MSENDPEIAALTTLIKVREPLNSDQRIRVLSFIFHKLDIRMPSSDVRGQQQGSELAVVLGTALDAKPPQPSIATTATDIRSLMETTEPLRQ